MNLSAWQGNTGGGGGGAVTCSNTPGQAGELVMDSACEDAWSHNATDLKFRSTTWSAHGLPDMALNIDCDGDYDNCRRGTVNTRICLGHFSRWTPTPKPPVVDNEGWQLNADGTVTAVASQKCLEVCYRGGAVGGCDGKRGSVLQLSGCESPPGKNQVFSWNATDGRLRQRFDGVTELCVAVPARPPGETMDIHSAVADPLFTDAAAGDFSLQPGSPAFKLGFKPIPKIAAPVSVCGDDAGAGAPSCLEAFFDLSAHRGGQRV
jgi:hypothetical protein